MKAIVYESFKAALNIRDVEIPEISSNSAIIKVMATGLCRSDWHGWMGHDNDIELPHVPGHEFAGIVSKVGEDVINFKPGDRVTVPFVCGCGSCNQCKSGNHQICDNQSQPGFTKWGSFAEYVAIEYADINLVQLPNNINYVEAAVLGCRFITAYRAIVHQAKLKSGESIAIHGCGGVGLSAILIARAIGCKILAIDINEDALSMAKDFGADLTLSAKSIQDLTAHIHKITVDGVDVSIDALGSQETCFNSISILKKRGRHIQLGLMTDEQKHPKIPMDLVIAKELEIYGSHGMQAYKYSEMFKLIETKNIPLHKLVYETISLEKATELLPRMNQFIRPGITVITEF